MLRGVTTTFGGELWSHPLSTPKPCLASPLTLVSSGLALARLALINACLACSCTRNTWRNFLAKDWDSLIHVHSFAFLNSLPSFTASGRQQDMDRANITGKLICMCCCSCRPSGLRVGTALKSAARQAKATGGLVVLPPWAVMPSWWVG